MHDEVDERPVVEARALQVPVVEQEPQRLDEMESQAGGGRQARYAAGVVRNLGMDKDQLHSDDDSGSQRRYCRFSNSETSRRRERYTLVLAAAATISSKRERRKRVAAAGLSSASCRE